MNAQRKDGFCREDFLLFPHSLESYAVIHVRNVSSHLLLPKDTDHIAHDTQAEGLTSRGTAPERAGALGGVLPVSTTRKPRTQPRLHMLGKHIGFFILSAL